MRAGRSAPIVARFGRARRPARIRERRDEAISLPRDRGDEPRPSVVVLELDPEAPHMAIDDVALGDEIGSPDRVDDLLAGDHPTRPAGKKVEEALLDPAQMDHRSTGPDLAIDDVDLHLA